MNGRLQLDPGVHRTEWKVVHIGATIMGRNMFGPIRRQWTDDDWKGWWGDNPPFHHPVFVLTHFQRESIRMDGGTSFHFVNGGIASALEQAFDAAKGGDVRIGGGSDTIQQYLRAGLVDEVHVAIAPILLGGGTRLFDNLEGGSIEYECIEMISAPTVVHVRFGRSGASSTETN
jgi:dihydrofolate reductase